MLYCEEMASTTDKKNREQEERNNEVEKDNQDKRWVRKNNKINRIENNRKIWILYKNDGWKKLIYKN